MQLRAMDVKAISRNLAATLRDMGARYDFERLAQALKGHELELTSRAAQVTITLGTFGARVAKVRDRARLKQSLGVVSRYL